MQKQIINRLIKSFEDYAYKKDNIEFWFARDLQILLGYSKWDNFLKVIAKAKLSCKNSNFYVLDHFLDARKMVRLGSGSKREIENLMLTRYACYLIAQNGDSRKEEIAFAQSYFAVQTRKQEIIEERIILKERLDAREKLNNSETELSKQIYERGVDDSGFARIRSKGDNALFGGNDTKKIKEKLFVPNNRPLADFLPTVTIAAKNFVTEVTNYNVKSDDLYGENKISNEHVKSNLQVREVMLKNKIIPEELSAEEDIKKIERKVKVAEQKLEQISKKKK